MYLRTARALLAVLATASLLAAPDHARSGPVTVIVPPVTIDQPGTYVLAASATVPMGQAIIVTSPHVVIDLCGFVIDGDGNNNAAILGTSGRLTVRNGRLRGWAVGVAAGHDSTVHDVEVRESNQGISLSNNARVERCRVLSISSIGISVGFRSIVRDCMVEIEVNGGTGVALGSGSQAQNVSTTGGGTGFGTGRGCILVDCTASGYESTGFTLQELSQARRCSAFEATSQMSTAGFFLHPHASLVDCSAGGSGFGVRAEGGNLVRGATVFDCATGIRAEAGVRIEHSLVSSSVLMGILALGPGVDVVECTVLGGDSNGVRFAAPGGSIERSHVEGTAGVGIELADACVARGNTLTGNFGPGIKCKGDRTRVEDNTLEANAIGIEVLGKHALLVRNRATNSTLADFQFGALNFLGPILQTSGWLNGASPHANFQTPLF